MSQDIQNAGIGSGPYGAGAAPEGGPLGAGAVGMDRVVKREMRSSRAVASVIAAALVMAVCAYALLETAVRAIGQPPWLVDPLTAAFRVVALPAGIGPLLLFVIGAVVAMVGLFFFLNAVLPGRKARHLLPDRRAAVEVDDEVIAAALARRARLAANVTQEQVMVTVSRNRVMVSVRPTSGMPLRPDTVFEAVRRELQEMGPWPMPEVRIQVSTAGVVGA